jgi:hypothetical protein
MVQGRRLDQRIARHHEGLTVVPKGQHPFVRGLSNGERTGPNGPDDFMLGSGQDVVQCSCRGLPFSCFQLSTNGLVIVDKGEEQC